MSLDALLRAAAPHLDRLDLRPGDGIVAAFSGGADSTALLLALQRLAAERRLRLDAAHLDHGLDPASAQRARRAAEIAGELGVPFHQRCQRGSVNGGEGIESAAREARYAFLEAERRRLGARFVATAHQRDDQVETVLLRLLQGSGLEGLAAMRPRRERIVRPLLGLSRRTLARAVDAAGLVPVDDPTNRDLERRRNWIRHALLPHLRNELALSDERVHGLAEAAAAAFAHIERLLESRLRPRITAASVETTRAAFASLPPELHAPALALLHRLAGARHPAGGAARAELVRQLAAANHIGCDCGDGWRWESCGDRLRLRRQRPAAPVFTYTLRVPGMVYIPEVSLGIRVRRGSFLPEILQGSTHSTALALEVLDGEPVTIRPRRPGDRIRPPGYDKARRLEDVLYDHGVPKDERDRLPLLCVGEAVIWVPGVTVDEGARAREGSGAWIAETVAAETRRDPT